MLKSVGDEAVTHGRNVMQYSAGGFIQREGELRGAAADELCDYFDNNESYGLTHIEGGYW